MITYTSSTEIRVASDFIGFVLGYDSLSTTNQRNYVDLCKYHVIRDVSALTPTIKHQVNYCVSNFQVCG